MALSFCLRDTAPFPAALHLRHPLLRASPECGAYSPARLFSSFAMHSCTRQKDYIIFCPLVQVLFSILCTLPARDAAARAPIDKVRRGFPAKELPPHRRYIQKNTTAPIRRGIGTGRQGRQCLYQDREIAYLFSPLGSRPARSSAGRRARYSTTAHTVEATLFTKVTPPAILVRAWATVYSWPKMYTLRK